MNTKSLARFALSIAAIFSGFDTPRAFASGTTVDSVNKYTYGANIGWVNWAPDSVNGAVIGEYVCSGWLYSANVRWICLGSNNPANSYQLPNNSAGDYGVGKQRRVRQPPRLRLRFEHRLDSISNPPARPRWI